MDKKAEKKKKVEVLYIEADKDHVSLQNGKKEMVKLVYVHEGVETKGRRRVLKNVHYKVFVGDMTGDGARWIKEGKVTPLYRTLRDIKYGNSI